MLYYRDYHWLLVPGPSRFTAWIEPQDEKPEDLRWLFALTYHAGGAPWRRVPIWQRPTLVLENHNFRPHLPHWTGLERVSFWHRDFSAPEDDHGWLCLEYLSGGPAGTRQTALFQDHFWRIAARDRHWFTLEFAGFNGLSLLDDAPEPLVLAGHSLSSTPPTDGSPADFWKANAQLYLIESLPFGMVTVQVPRNVRDPEAYALRRAHTLLGLERPEHMEIYDHAQQSPYPLLHGDLYVHLHFHGYYED